MKKIFVLALLLSGCYTDRRPDESLEHHFVRHMEYYKDDRTSLCYAVSCPSCNSAMMTNVPCTPEVEKLLSK